MAMLARRVFFDLQVMVLIACNIHHSIGWRERDRFIESRAGSAVHVRLGVPLACKVNMIPGRASKADVSKRILFGSDDTNRVRQY